jgi:hypothetical protein
MEILLLISIGKTVYDVENSGRGKKNEENIREGMACLFCVILSLGK